jgi:hypothetical protein
MWVCDVQLAAPLVGLGANATVSQGTKLVRSSLFWKPSFGHCVASGGERIPLSVNLVLQGRMPHSTVMPSSDFSIRFPGGLGSTFGAQEMWCFVVKVVEIVGLAASAKHCRDYYKSNSPCMQFQPSSQLPAPRCTQVYAKTSWFVAKVF